MKRSVGESLIFSALIIIMLMAPGFIDGLEPVQQLCVMLIIDALLFLYMLYRHYNRGEFSRENQLLNKKNFLIILPVFLPFVAVFLYFVFTGMLDTLNILWAFNYPMEIDNWLSWARFLAIVQFSLFVLIEEMVFRMFFFKMIPSRNRALKIIISAGIFALFDILLLLQRNVTFQFVAYSMLVSFLLGIVLGAIVEYGHCVYFSMLFHIIFKITYWGFEVSLFAPNFYSSAVFVNPVILLSICVAYLAIMYFVFFRKKELD